MAYDVKSQLKNPLQKPKNSDMILKMEVKEESRLTLEPRYLAQALASGVKIRIGQMNKTEHEGIIRDVGRYEINIDENGKLVTILKQEISFFSAPHPILTFPTTFSKQTGSTQQHDGHDKPNIQQEFLDRAIKENQTLTFFLINGQRIKAHIEAYDSFTILIKEGGTQHLYYKHAITTINR